MWPEALFKLTKFGAVIVIFQDGDQRPPQLLQKNPAWSHFVHVLCWCSAFSVIKVWCHLFWIWRPTYLRALVSSGSSSLLHVFLLKIIMITVLFLFYKCSPFLRHILLLFAEYQSHNQKYDPKTMNLMQTDAAAEWSWSHLTQTLDAKVYYQSKCKSLCTSGKWWGRVPVCVVVCTCEYGDAKWSIFNPQSNTQLLNVACNSQYSPTGSYPTHGTTNVIYFACCTPHLLLICRVSLSQGGVQDHVSWSADSGRPADPHCAVSDIKQLQVVDCGQGHCRTQSLLRNLQKTNKKQI